MTTTATRDETRAAALELVREHKTLSEAYHQAEEQALKYRTRCKSKLYWWEVLSWLRNWTANRDKLRRQLQERHTERARAAVGYLKAYAKAEGRPEYLPMLEEDVEEGLIDGRELDAIDLLGRAESTAQATGDRHWHAGQIGQAHRHYKIAEAVSQFFERLTEGH